MQVSVSARHMEVSKGVKDFAEKKAENLDRLFSGLTQIEIVLDAADGGHHAELIAHQSRGEKFVAESKAADMYQAITEVIEKMDRQLRKKKQILKQRRKRGAGQREAALLSEVEENAALGEHEEIEDMEEEGI